MSLGSQGVLHSQKQRLGGKKEREVAVRLM